LATDGGEKRLEIADAMMALVEDVFILPDGQVLDLSTADIKVLRLALRLFEVACRIQRLDEVDFPDQVQAADRVPDFDGKALDAYLAEMEHFSQPPEDEAA
jgi:hypothetical protein